MQNLRVKVDFLLGRTKSHKVFVLGTGRSGTHWIAYVLQAHPQIRATIEKEPMFSWATQMALDPSMKQALFPKLVRRYRWEHFVSAPAHYVDKSHPNMWLAEELATVFEDALFVGIERGVYATVASMLKHKGVLEWHRNWQKFPIPNAFLGITSGMAEYYDKLPLAAKCSFRWKSHRERMRSLKTKLKGRLLVIQYEELIQNTGTNLQKLETFLDLDAPIPIPRINRESLDKWKNQLTDSEIEQIASVLGFAPS